MVVHRSDSLESSEEDVQHRSFGIVRPVDLMCIASVNLSKGERPEDEQRSQR